MANRQRSAVRSGRAEHVDKLSATASESHADPRKRAQCALSGEAIAHCSPRYRASSRRQAGPACVKVSCRADKRTDLPPTFAKGSHFSLSVFLFFFTSNRVASSPMYSLATTGLSGVKRGRFPLESGPAHRRWLETGGCCENAGYCSHFARACGRHRTSTIRNIRRSFSAPAFPADPNRVSAGRDRGGCRAVRLDIRYPAADAPAARPGIHED